MKQMFFDILHKRCTGGESCAQAEVIPPFRGVYSYPLTHENRAVQDNTSLYRGFDVPPFAVPIPMQVLG
jgi:hypothetical protein